MSSGKSEKRWKQQPKKDTRLGLPSLSALVLLSGFASLVYQVLWMRHLGLLFGNSSQAAAATLAVFFAGMGVGSWWWARRLADRPLKLYALLELGIAASALAYFLVRVGLTSLYPSVYGAMVGTPWLLVAKLLMAVMLIFPAAFFMGGTIPAMAQVAVGERSRFGRVSAWLYGLNTLGATLGVLVGAFLLLPEFGSRWSYTIALLCSLLAAVWAWSGSKAELTQKAAPKLQDEGNGSLEPMVAVLAFVSGFVVLALEVAWTRIFAQVHENSVYSFAVILAVVLMGLALGALISSLLSRLNKPPKQILMLIMLAAGALLVLGPAMIMKVTDGLQPVHTNESWGEYLRNLFRMGIGGVGFTVIALGVVFPFLMKMAEDKVRVPGSMLGRLLAINTLGAILGSLICGFVLLPVLGMWTSVRFLTVVHLIAALMIPIGWNRHALLMRGAGVAFMVLFFTLLDPSKLPIIVNLPGAKPFKVLEAWEGADCTVAVIEKQDGHRAIMINSSYSLGSTAAYVEQANQSRIPLYLYPDTKSICFIGIGTGMSAGAALDKDRFPNVERVLACELSPSVVEAAKKWMPEAMKGGLFTDPRSEVLVEDGRHHLMASEERFDMINADLFLPYQRGAGSLYSLDHYRVVADRLNDGGVFVQWLPMYQITDYEFGVIANTMLQVFEEVTMWRNNFVPGQEKVALIGRLETGPLALPPSADRDDMRGAVQGLDWRYTMPDMVRVEPESTPFLYCGNLSLSRELFESYPINSDDHPLIEFQTPWRFREVAQQDKVIWCVGPKLTAWIERIFEKSRLADDPHFEGHKGYSLHLVEAGKAFHRAMVAKALGNQRDTEIFWRQFQVEWIEASKPE